MSNKFKIVFLISEENKWEHLMMNIKHVNQRMELVDRIAIVAIDTAILACLKDTIMDDCKSQVTNLSAINVDFFLCINTCIKYGIKTDSVLPEFKIAEEGGILKVMNLQEQGYRLISL